MNQTAIEPNTSVASAMLAEFEREFITTRKFLQRLPGDRLAWRPHAKSMSAGQLGYHIAETPERALRGVLADRVSPPDFLVREEATSVADLLAMIDQGAAFVRQTLPTLDDARMRATFTLDFPDGSVVQMPRAAFVRSIMLNHWYHHRGQLGVYLRLLGVSVPSSYGPSGDETGGI